MVRNFLPHMQRNLQDLASNMGVEVIVELRGECKQCRNTLHCRSLYRMQRPLLLVRPRHSASPGRPASWWLPCPCASARGVQPVSPAGHGSVSNILGNQKALCCTVYSDILNLSNSTEFQTLGLHCKLVGGHPYIAPGNKPNKVCLLTFCKVEDLHVHRLKRNSTQAHNI